MLNTNDNMLVPMPCQGIQDQIPIRPGYEWIKKLPDKKIYFALFQRWPNQDLPVGYEYYIVSFHLEVIDIEWVKRQKVSGPIIVLADGQSYNFKIPGVYFLSFYYWHYQLQKMQEWFGIKEKVTPNYKFSVVCNRITQSKLWITTKLLETAKELSLIVLNSWFEEKNVHGWQSTGNVKLDQLTQLFQQKYLGQEIKIDNFDNDTQNLQNITGTPWQPLYQDCAINFTNESFHYSGMFENGQEYIWPGPFITEKTLKCLLGGTAFIPVGQFETYKTLANLGLNFDYKFDTTWDDDPGNLSRAENIINLIDELNQYTVEQLVNKTQETSRYNQNYIASGKFFEQCQQKNKESIAQIFDLIR
jgi:hypothetical protein